jgi:biotin carboxyl carrier protein
MKEFNYKINGAPYKVVILNSDDSTIELEVNGIPYTVELEQKTKKPLAGIRRPSREAAPAPTPQSTSTPLVTKPTASPTKNVIQSPLPGIIVDIKCKEGDIVKKGQTLMVLEAMKMENNILATTNGKVSQILVNKGDTVLEGADLVVIE